MKKLHNTLLLFCCLISSLAFGQQVIELKDIYEGPQGSDARNMILGPDGQYYFSALEPGNQNGLWKTNGTTASTVKVSNIDSRIEFNIVNNENPIFSDGNLLYFWTSDGSDGNLNVSNGNIGNLQQIYNLPDTEYDREVANFVQTSGGVFFANDFDIYRSDGTSGGTQKVRYDPGGTNYLTVVDDEIYYFTQTDAGNFLYKGNSNGQNFQQVAQIGEAGNGNRIFNLDGRLAYVRSISGTTQSDVTVDGFPTSEGVGIGFQPSTRMVIANNEVFFFARKDDKFGLHKIDANGTTLLKEFTPNANGSLPSLSSIKVINGQVAILVINPPEQGVYAVEYWVSDGTVGGTNLINSYGAGSTYRPVFTSDDLGRTFFVARPVAADFTQALALYETNATVAGTQKIVDVPVLETGSTLLNFLYDGDDKIYFSQRRGNFLSVGSEPYVIDLDATGNCSITAVNDFYACLNQGTTDPTDDVYNVRINVDGEFTGLSGWESTSGISPAIEGGYNLGLGVLVENVPATFNNTITIADKEKPSCISSIEIDLPGSCSDPALGQDLILENLAAPSSTPAGTAFGFTYDVRYIGWRSVGSTPVRAWFSSDQVASRDDTQTGDTYFGFPASGARFDNTKIINIPPNLAPGTYYLILKIDHFVNQLDEVNENNNELIIPVLITNGDLECNITASIGAIECNDRNTPNPADDTFTFKFTATGSGDIDNSYSVFVNGLARGQGVFGVEATSSPILISEGILDVQFRTQGDAVCSFGTTVTPPAPCSGGACSINLSEANKICRDNGTPNDPTDDFFELYVNVSGNNTSGQWTTAVNSGNNFDYGNNIYVGNFDTGAGGIEFFAFDAANGSCFDVQTFQRTSSCSDGGGDGPTVTLSTPSSTVDGAFNVSMQFSESVTDMTLAEIVVTNGTKSNAAQQSGSSYSFTVTPTNPGVVTVLVNANSAFDGDGNGNQESNLLSVTFGTTDEPDLFGQFNSGAPVVEEGEDFLFRYSVRNLSSEPAGASVARVYLSTDQNISGDDQLIVSQNVPALAGNDFELYTENLSIDAAGSYFFLLEVDATDQVDESNENNNFVSRTIQVNSIGGGGVDLALTSSVSNSNPAPYAFFSTTFTLTNTGDATANNVGLVWLNDDAGFVPKGGDEVDASQGSANPVTQFWNVGSLAAGASATLTLNYFNLNESSKRVWAEVSQQSPSDSDSNAGNGTPFVVNEDDEALATINGGGNDLPDLVADQVNILDFPDENFDGLGVQFLYSNPGTAITSNQEPLFATVYISTDRNLSSNDIEVSNSPFGFGAGSVVLGGSLPASTPDGTYYVLVEIDPDNNITESNESNNVVASFNTFTIGDVGGDLPDLNLARLTGLAASAKQGDVEEFTFDLINSGTATATGIYEVEIYLSTDGNLDNNDVEVGRIVTGNTPVGTIAGVEGAITVPANQAPGAYFLIIYADANNSITESNESNNFLSGNITIQEDGGGDGVDVNLVGAASNNTPAQWTFFSIELVVSNTGSDAASGLQVEVPIVDGIKLKGGDEFDASQGSFNPYGNRKWNVGSLGAGQSATLVLNYFNTSSSAVTLFAQVSDLNESDSDSSPSNNNGTTPNEDDEVAVTVNANASSARRGSFSESERNIENQIRDFSILKIYPSLTANDTRIVLNSKKETSMTMKVYNTSGQEVYLQAIEVAKGINQIDVEASSLESGMYHIMLQPQEGRPLMTRFMKANH